MINQTEVKLAIVKLAIVGSRNFKDEDFFLTKINEWIDKYGVPDLIVSGGAKGADTLGENYAIDNDIPTIILKPTWRINGKYIPWAGLQRNTDIVNESTHILAFPSHKGKGTQDTIKKGEKKNKNVTVYWID